MRGPGAALVLAYLGAGLAGGCAQFSQGERPPGAGSDYWVAAQPIEPEALRPGMPFAGRTLVVLLPKANGTAGAVVVRSGRSQVLLDKPFAAGGVHSAGQVQAFRFEPADIGTEFGSAIAALPGRPATFTLYFQEGTDTLTSDSEAEIARVFREIALRPDPEISVIGHTDALGTAQFNDQLSLQRAQRVRSELVRRGIAADRIDVSGRGKREPLVATADGVSEPKNRRVEINVR